MKLPNYVCGRWVEGEGEGAALHDPVSGEIIATVSSAGIDCGAALAFAREHGGSALRAMSYAERGALLARIAEVLGAKRADYFAISQRNSGATEGDASFDVDGAIFTLKSYAKAARALGEGRGLAEGAVIPLSKEDSFSARHYLTPLKGVAVFINAFNFPAWGLWEKAAPALLSGVPVVVKPATPTAWLTQRMVHDVVEAGILPIGAISIVCGSARDLLDHVTESDVVSFTGSAETAARIRTHAAVVARSVRVNVEADSVNSAVLGPDGAPGKAEFDLLVKEVAREMTVKSGQKCTAIRRVFAPRAVARQLADAIAGRLAGVKVGNPKNPEVRMGPLVSCEQQKAALAGLALLKSECEVVFGGDPAFAPIDADPAVSAFVQPTLLFCEHGGAAQRVHDTEVFGPVATVIAYDDLPQLLDLVRRGQGSLVASVFSGDAPFVDAFVPEIGDLHGRVMVIDTGVGNTHTGHGNVMPNCLHGGPGRAGGGEELGGLRALALYHRRYVVQAAPARLAAIAEGRSDAAALNA